MREFISRVSAELEQLLEDRLEESRERLNDCVGEVKVTDRRKEESRDGWVGLLFDDKAVGRLEKDERTEEEEGRLVDERGFCVEKLVLSLELVLPKLLEAAVEEGAGSAEALDDIVEWWVKAEVAVLPKR